MTVIPYAEIERMTVIVTAITKMYEENRKGKFYSGVYFACLHENGVLIRQEIISSHMAFSKQMEGRENDAKEAGRRLSHIRTDRPATLAYDRALYLKKFKIIISVAGMGLPEDAVAVLIAAMKYCKEEEHLRMCDQLKARAETDKMAHELSKRNPHLPL